MTLSPERLAELRAMPYEEYRATHEWQARQRSILTRESVCQICQTEARLSVYHYDLSRQGAEEDTDLLILCASCYEKTRAVNIPTLPFLHRAGVFVGTAALSTIGLEGFLHAPLPAEVGALIAAYFLAKNSPALYATMKNHLPPEVMAWMGLSTPPGGKRSGLSRWFASPQETQAMQRTDASAQAGVGATEASADEDGDEEDLWEQDSHDTPPTVAFNNDTDDDDGADLPEIGSRRKITVFSELLKSGWRPTLESIYVGTDARGHHRWVSAKDLCHVALAGATGHGKSSLLRLIMAQLCSLKLPIVLLNPHYMIFDLDHNEDWTPYTPYLQRDPIVCKQTANIEVVLKWMAEELLEKRKARTARGESAGKPFFFILDEYPDMKAEIKDAPKYVGKILRQGRKYGIFLIVASQDFSVKTLGVEGEGAVRKCFLTTFYVGGDPITARELLNVSVRDIPENDLGKGTIMLKYAGCDDPILAWVPYVDNESLYLLLGPSTFVRPAQEDVHTGELEDATLQDNALRQLSEPDEAQSCVRNAASGPDGVNHAQISPTQDERSDRRNGDEVAPEAGVDGQITNALPPGWTQDHVKMLPFLYKACGNLDTCLITMELSKYPRNRDFAREILKRQGLWKEK
jgi:hypothetical protein